MKINKGTFMYDSIRQAVNRLHPGKAIEHVYLAPSYLNTRKLDDTRAKYYIKFTDSSKTIMTYQEVFNL